MANLGVASFDSQVDAFRLARNVLAARLRDDLPPDDLSTELLAREVLPALERVRRGLSASLRAREADAATNRDLVLREGVGDRIENVAERAASRLERDRLATDRPPALDTGAGAMLGAVSHARIVFAQIPRLPAALVTWPLRRLGTGYADITAPLDAGALFGRVDELDAVVWRLAVGRPLDADEHVRRTYAFCETAVWLDATLGPRG